MFRQKEQVAFGGPSPYRTYVTRMRWGYCFLLTVIVLLSAALISVARDARDAMALSSQQVPAQDRPVPASPPVPVPVVKTVPVLLANQIIRAGDELSASMFTTRDVTEELVPPGVLVSKDLQSLEGKFVRNDVSPNVMIQSDVITEERPITPFHIPTGMRAVTIFADKQTGVEGYAKAGSLVDILWVYTEPGDTVKQIATIVRFARVLSVGGQTDQGTASANVNALEGRTPFTILATEKDAKAIQLAGSSGVLTLALVGSDERVADSMTESTEVLTLFDVLKREKNSAPPKCTLKDPATGKVQTYLFRNNEWTSLDNKES